MPVLADQRNDQRAAWPELVFTTARASAALTALVSAVFVVLGLSTLGFVDFGGGNLAPWSKTWLGALLCLLVFVPSLLVSLMIVRRRGAVVRVGPLGVRDVRIADAWIPWKSITGHALARPGGGLPSVMLQIEDNVASTLPFTRTARAFRVIGALFGYRGYSVSSRGLREDFGLLIGAVEDGLARTRKH